MLGRPFAPANDVAHDVVCTRVGPVHTPARLTTLAVIGQRGKHFTGMRMHSDPLGAIHWRSPHHISSFSGVDQYISLCGKAFVCSEAVFTLYQSQPLTMAIGIETSDIQRAMV